MGYLKEIPTKEWEDCVEILDRMTVLEELGDNNPEADEEYAKLKLRMDYFYSNYDVQYINERYEESLKRL
jgi:hypothetical protein